MTAPADRQPDGWREALSVWLRILVGLASLIWAGVAAEFAGLSAEAQSPDCNYEQAPWTTLHGAWVVGAGVLLGLAFTILPARGGGFTVVRKVCLGLWILLVATWFLGSLLPQYFPNPGGPFC